LDEQPSGREKGGEMRGINKWLSSVLSMFILFILFLSSPLPATAAVPGLDP